MTARTVFDKIPADELATVKRRYASVVARATDEVMVQAVGEGIVTRDAVVVGLCLAPTRALAAAIVAAGPLLGITGVDVFALREHLLDEAIADVRAGLAEAAAAERYTVLL